MRPTTSVERLHGLPPVVVVNIDAASRGPGPLDPRVQEILLVFPEPSLRQSLGLVAHSLKVLVRCTCRHCSHYCLVYRDGYAYTNHWYTRDAAR